MRVHDHLPLEELQRLAKAIAGKRLWKRYTLRGPSLRIVPAAPAFYTGQ
jgi:hypothetical protein